MELAQRGQVECPSKCFVCVGRNTQWHAQWVMMGKNRRVVSKRDIDEFKRQTEIPISFETSAKQNYNVSVAFEEIAHQSYQIFTKKIAVKSGQTKSMQLTAPKK